MAIAHRAAEIESVSFTDLSRNPKGVATRAAALGRLRVTHRDAPDMMLTTVARAEHAEENLTTASRLFLALMKQDDGARSLQLALPEVFPWARHLDAEETRAFTDELLGALSDAAELGAGEAVHRAVVSWRATARVNADPDQLRESPRPLDGDVLGQVEVRG
ncbi:prevent-host-death family protein [Streptomyces sp. AC536]|uniref:prevent-host-death family protein n=1 Tax=Streptomyces buecherae TaxID=2763006 RepID=UPI00164D2CAD|nr:prevent-host-death family protein [Streptomyces buecherae]MBC3982364.1 prevent-host-death family protein [Streptomyces buecherae]QNJ40954.1 prevent-host-death family protein [Streptomyces buecherae]